MNTNNLGPLGAWCLELLKDKKDIDLSEVNLITTRGVRDYILISLLDTVGTKLTTTTIDNNCVHNAYCINLNEHQIFYTIRFKYTYLADATGWLGRENNSITKIPIGIKNIYFEV